MYKNFVITIVKWMWKIADITYREWNKIFHKKSNRGPKLWFNKNKVLDNIINSKKLSEEVEREWKK